MYNVSFLPIFIIFSFSSVFRSLVMACLSIALFRFVLFGFTQLLHLIGCIFWQIFLGNQEIFSFHFFDYSLAPLSSFSFFGTLLFVIVPLVPEALLTFFFSIFFLSVVKNWVNSSYLSLSSPIFLCIVSSQLINLLGNFKFYLLYFLIL